MLSRLVMPNWGLNGIMKINNKITDLKLSYKIFKYSDLFPLNVINDMGKNPNDTVKVSIRKSKFHLRWMHTGWPCVIELASMTIGGDVGWRIAFNGSGNDKITSCWDGTLIGEIPPAQSPMTCCNIPGYSASAAASLFNTGGSYSGVPPLANDTTNWDIELNDAMYLDNLPLFRTWQPTHESQGVKYSTDLRAFKEIDLDNDSSSITYELQMNDSLSYGESSYDDAAFVFYKLR